MSTTKVVLNRPLGRVRWSGPADQSAAPPHNNQLVSAATVFLSHNNQLVSAKFQTSERGLVCIDGTFREAIHTSENGIRQFLFFSLSFVFNCRQGVRFVILIQY